MTRRTLTLALILTLLITLVASVAIDLTAAETPPTTWNKNYPQLQGSGRALIQTSDGGYAMAGWNYASTMGFPSGDWVVKTDTLRSGHCEKAILCAS